MKSSFEWSNSKQLSIFKILLAFILPSSFAFIGFRVVLPLLVNNGYPKVPMWFFLGIMIMGLVLSLLAKPLIDPFMRITGLHIPDYMPFWLDTSIDPMKVDIK